jgi:hypothetical protein
MGLPLEEILATPRGRGAKPVNWHAVWWLALGRGVAPDRIARAIATGAGSISRRIQCVVARRDRDEQARAWIERLRGGSGGVQSGSKSEKEKI